MSVFMISDKTMARVVNTVTKRNNGYPTGHPFTFGGLALEHNKAESLSVLGTALYKMNAEAMHQRYGDIATVTDEAPAYRHRNIWPESNRYQDFKSVRCLIYQASEGDVPETSDLFKALEQMAGDMAYDIVSQDHRFDAAEWD